MGIPNWTRPLGGNHSVVDRIEDQVFVVLRTPVPGDDLAAAADDHLMDIATDPDLPVKGSNFGRFGEWLRPYPGGSECRSIFFTVSQNTKSKSRFVLAQSL